MAVKTKKRLSAKAMVVKRASVQMYWSGVDWSELWEEWYSKLAPNNMPLHKSIVHFAKAVTTIPKQREFLVWYLGKKDDNWKADPRAKLYPFITDGPQDWEEKRRSHGWYSPHALRVFSKSITQRTTALDKLAAAGDTITLYSLSRMEGLARQIDEQFQGKLFHPQLTEAQNEKRAKLYLALHGKVLSYIEKAQSMYAKSHGINFDDMQGFAHIIAASIQLSAISGDASKSREQSVIDQLVKMTLAKSAKHRLPLPEGMEDKIIDVTPDTDPSKGNIQ